MGKYFTESGTHFTCQRDSTQRMETSRQEQTFRNVFEPEEIMEWNNPLGILKKNFN